MNVPRPRRLLLIAWALAALCAGGVKGAAAKEPFREFSADIVTVDKGGETTGKAFLGKDKTRIEYTDTVIITRVDRNKSWVFFPKERVYIERPIDRKLVTSASGKSANEVFREPLGEEAVDGRPARKYRVTYQDKAGTVAVLQWIAIDGGTPIKAASDDGSWSIEYRNIRMGPVDPKLFEIPEGFVPAEKPALPPVVADYAEKNDD